MSHSDLLLLAIWLVVFIISLFVTNKLIPKTSWKLLRMVLLIILSVIVASIVLAASWGALLGSNLKWN